jgi:hypothetical protein
MISSSELFRMTGTPKDVAAFDSVFAAAIF